MKRGRGRLFLRELRTPRGLLIAGALPLLLLVWIYSSAVVSTLRVKQFDDWWSRPKSVRHFVGYQLRGWARAPRALALERRLDPEREAPGVLRLEVPRSSWDRISSDPQAMFGVSISGRVHSRRGLLPVKLRVRGDTSVHWTTEKISFTLRTPKDGLFLGHRKLAFTGKEALTQHLAASLAREFGLLAPESSLVDVYLHDRFYGVFRAVEIPDESFLRRRDLLPGEIFRGDTAERGEVFANVPRWLFLNPYIWDRSASGGLSKAEALEALQGVIRDCNRATQDSAAALLSHFDADEIGRLLAFLLVVGDPYHQSNIHNQYWYRDPSTARWHPIPWDVFVRPLGAGHGESINRLLQTLIDAPAVWDACLRCLHRQLIEGELELKVREILDAARRDHGSALAYDRLRAGAISDVGEAGALLRIIQGNIAKLRGRLGKPGLRFAAQRLGDGLYILDFESEGSGCELVGLELRRAGAGAAVRAQLVPDRDGDGSLSAAEKLRGVPLSFERAGDPLRASIAPIPLLAAANAAKGLPQPSARHYRFFLVLSDDLGSETDLGITPALRARLDGQPLRARAWRSAARIGSRSSVPRIDPPPRTVVWSSDRRLTETVFIPAGQTLRIEEGVELKLGAEVSLVVQGRLLASGVSFLPLEERVPWGSLILFGNGARGSRLRGCRLRGGSSAIHEGVQYKGMMSIHRVRDLRIEGCSFAANLRSDDCLNVVGSEVTLRDCAFKNANADAADFDLSRGAIIDCRFEDSGNDAIDLMGSSVMIAGNTILRSGDKGISVGERSAPLIIDNRIEGCGCGVEVKDGSTPWLLYNRIRKNAVGLRQKLKNWRYGDGGRGRLVGSEIEGNRSDFLSDSQSHLARASAEDRALLFPYLLRSRGFVGRDRGAKRTAGERFSWAPSRPGKPALQIAFQEDFESLSDGWVGLEGSPSPRKRKRDLAVDLRELHGGMEKAVDWKLPAGCEDLLVFELGLRAEGEISVSAHRRGGEWVARQLKLHDSWRIVPLRLPAGSYDRVRVEVETKKPGARLRLRGVSRFFGPRKGPR